MPRRGRGIDHDQLFATQVEAALAATRPTAQPPSAVAPPQAQAASAATAASPPPQPATIAGPAALDPVGQAWRQVTVIACLGAHPQAGTSTVAIAIADAAAAAGGDAGARLVDAHPPELSGLTAAADAELGMDPSGTWALGRRGQLQIVRRSAEGPPALPQVPTPGTVQVLDGHVSAALLPDLPMRHVLVCRASVPSLRAAERRLTSMSNETLVMAVLGPPRWPGVLTSTLGPAVRHLREAGRVVAVPVDRQLDVTGLTSQPLPRPVAQAGLHLLQLSSSPPHLTAAEPSEEGIHG